MIRRTYGCDTCGLVWTHDHRSGNEDFLSECPRCAGKPEWQPRPVAVAFGAKPETSWKVPDTPSKRADFAARIAMEDHKITNIRSNMQEGDKAAIDVPSDAKFEKVQQVIAGAKAASVPGQADTLFHMVTGSPQGGPPPPNIWRGPRK